MITSYDNLPMGKYQRIIEALKANTDEIDAHVEMLAILNDMKKEDVYDMPLEDYARISEAASFLLQPLPDVTGKIEKEYVCGDMILVPVTDVKKFTAAQYIDYQQMLKEDGKVVELCSTLVVPKGHKYADGYDIADVHRAIAEHLSVMQVFHLSAFFLRKLKSSIKHSLTYLQGRAMWVLKKKEDRRILSRMVKAIRLFMKNGDGLTM